MKEIINFTIWKDNNFLLHSNGSYYPKTASIYFDITKYIGKEKPTKFFTIEQLVNLFKLW